WQYSRGGVLPHLVAPLGRNISCFLSCRVSLRLSSLLLLLLPLWIQSQLAVIIRIDRDDGAQAQGGFQIQGTTAARIERLVADHTLGLQRVDALLGVAKRIGQDSLVIRAESWRRFFDMGIAVAQPVGAPHQGTHADRRRV